MPPPLQVCIWCGRETSFHHGVTVTISPYDLVSPLFLGLSKNLIFFFKVAIFGIEIPEHRGNKLVVLKYSQHTIFEQVCAQLHNSEVWMHMQECPNVPGITLAGVLENFSYSEGVVIDNLIIC